MSRSYCVSFYSADILASWHDKRNIIWVLIYSLISNKYKEENKEETKYWENRALLNSPASKHTHSPHRSFKSVTTCSSGVSIIRRRHDGDRYGSQMFKVGYFRKSWTCTGRKTRSPSCPARRETSMKPDIKCNVKVGLFVFGQWWKIAQRRQKKKKKKMVFCLWRLWCVWKCALTCCPLVVMQTGCDRQRNTGVEMWEHTVQTQWWRYVQKHTDYQYKEK